LLSQFTKNIPQITPTFGNVQVFRKVGDFIRYLHNRIDISEKDAGTIHELSLPRVSGYAYLIFGDVYY
ncbi:MAG: hypothetical protein ACKPEO_10810, partial [Sphaerospermopsis kisseleviana]